MSYKITFIMFLMSEIFLNCVSEKITYFSVEHPCVTYYNPKFLAYMNLSSRRHGRRNPVYYVGMHFSTIVTINDTYNVDFFLYEWLTNVYKPSFIEFHNSLCSFIAKDQMFGTALRQGKLLKPCPYPPGEYHLVNMTANPAFIPPGFPFTRGRIYCNVSHSKTKERVLETYIDLKIEQINKKVVKNIF